MSQQPQDSPFRASHHSHQANVAAGHEHAIANRAIQPRSMERYISHIKHQLEVEQYQGKRREKSLAWDEIVAKPAVVQAHAALVAISKSSVEPRHYGRTTKLLNCISYAFFRTLRRADARALIFASGPGTRPSGDILGTLFAADYISYLGNRADLEYALTIADHRRPLPWPEMQSVGEQKTPTNPNDGMGQLKSYMAALKRYRPDLPTVRGFKVHAGRVMLAELNACGMWTSNEVGCDSLEPWVAYVVGLYLSLDTRDRKLQFNATQNDFVHWNVMDCTGPEPVVKYAISPFYVARAPGRITFATFRLSTRAMDNHRGTEAFYERDVEGFWKLSWQQKNARSNEKDLLRSLHKDGWLPGLVRLYDDNEDAGEVLEVPTAKDIQKAAVAGPGAQAAGPSTDQLESTIADNIVVDRIQDIVHLASIGQPLSQCGSVRELLYTFYDLLETLIHMWGEDSEDDGVLHRDVSWFNVLYDPIHYTKSQDQRNVLKRPCATEIMHELTLQPEGPGVEGCADQATRGAALDAPSFAPRVLLTDLDHAIEKKLLKENPNVGREKTGTPMFMSVELADYEGMEYDSGVSMHPLLDALEAIDKLPQGPLALQRAFPKGDKGFMAKFIAVMAQEQVRRAPLPLNSRPCHRPRHDAESSFWVFLWAALRALPVDAPETPSKKDADAFTQFCEAMLRHVVSDDAADVRSGFLERRKHFRRLFHPALAPLFNLFESMAHYLSVPWHHYEQLKMVADNHVHVAFRRLLLHFFLTVDREVLDIALDTTHPRVMKYIAEDSKERKASLPVSALAQLRASQRDSELSGFPESQSRKRKAEDPADPTERGTGASKRAATKVSSSEDAQFAASDASDQCNSETDYRAMTEESYDPGKHAHKRTAHALRLKFWKDRQLWFSKGE